MIMIKVIFWKWTLNIQCDYTNYTVIYRSYQCKKLIRNLFNKKKYVAHINSLKQALNHGLKLKKIHRKRSFLIDE